MSENNLTFSTGRVPSQQIADDCPLASSEMSFAINSRLDIMNNAIHDSYPSESDLPYISFDITTSHEESLKAGKIPVRLAEQLQLIHAESNEKKLLEDSLHEISSRLIQAIPTTQSAKREFSEFDEVHQGVICHISASTKPNAMVLSHTKPSIVVVTKGLICGERSLQSLDALAFVVAHELAHKAIEAKYGTRCSSKGEEGLADLLAVEIMHHAGFDARSALEILSISERPKTPQERFSAMVDVHPGFETRTGILEVALTKLEKEVGELNIAPTPLANTSLPECASALTFTEFRPPRPPSDFEQSLNKKKEFSSLETNFDKLFQIQQAFSHADFDDRRTITDISNRLGEITIEPEDQDSLLIVHQLADRCLLMAESNADGNEVYKALSHCCREALPKLRDSSSLHPLGRFQRLSGLISEFIAAEGKDETLSTATTLLREFESEQLKSSRLFKQISWPEFRFKPKVGTKVGFQPHYEVARSLRPNDRATITKALLAIGVEDSRLIRQLNLREYLDALKGAYTYTKKASKNGFFVRDAELTRTGTISEIGKPGSRVSVGCSMERFSKIPDLIESTFASLDDNNPSKEGIALLQEAASIFSDFQESTEETPDYIIGVAHLEKNPRLFVSLNRDSIETSPELQFQVIAKLESLIEEKHPRAREVLRVVLSVEKKSKGLNPFGSQLPESMDEPTVEQQDQILLRMPLASWTLKLPPELVSGPEKVQLLFGQMGELYQTGSLLCSEIKGKHALDILGKDFPEFSTQSQSYEELFEKYDTLEEISTSAIDKRILPALLEMECRVRAKSEAPTAQQLSMLIDKVGADSVRNDPILLEVVQKHFENTPPGWSKLPEEAISEWINLHEANLMPPGQAYQQLNPLLSSLQSTFSTPKRIAIVEKLLAGRRIADPKVRERAITIWARGIEQAVGRDDQSQKFQNRLEQVVERIKDTQPVLRMEMLDSLGKRLRTQRDGTQVLESGLPALSREVLEQSQGKGILAEIGASLLRREAPIRKIILQFITGPLTQQTALNFVEETLEEWNVESVSCDTLKDVSGDGKLADVSGEDFEALRTKQKMVEEATHFHRNFWSAPFEARAVIAREMLLPPGNTTPAEAQEMFELALGITFPSKRKYADKAKEFVRAYIDCVPEYSKHIAISALMVAAERSRGRSASVGFALASFLESMGPAEVKAGQAAESHPSVPKSIREDLARLKTSANEPTRWGLWSLIDDCVPEETKNQIASVNEVLGSASFYVVASITMQNGDNKVLALLRPNALSRAENGFRLMSEMAKSLGEGHPAFKTLLELIEQATELAKIESNPLLSKGQIEQARSIYNGSAVQVDGFHFEFSVPAVGEVGQRYRLMDQADGAHFLDLPDKPDTIERKRAIAKGIAAFELSLILRGLPFDDDRHGGNCKIKGNVISHFDFGGMMLEPPSDDELKQFGEVVANVLSRTSREGDFADEYFHEIKKLKEVNGSVPSLVKRVQKALLSLGDYRRYFQGDDLVDVLATAAQSAHPTLRYVVLSKLMAATGPQGLPPDLIAKLITPPIRLIWPGE